MCTNQRAEPSLVCFRSNPPTHQWNPTCQQIQINSFYTFTFYIFLKRAQIIANSLIYKLFCLIGILRHLHDVPNSQFCSSKSSQTKPVRQTAADKMYTQASRTLRPYTDSSPPRFFNFWSFRTGTRSCLLGANSTDHILVVAPVSN